MDIEGYELTAIRGMKACAARNRVSLQVELFAPRVEQVKNELAGIGMSHVARIGDDHYFANF